MASKYDLWCSSHIAIGAGVCTRCSQCNRACLHPSRFADFTPKAHRCRTYRFVTERECGSSAYPPAPPTGHNTRGRFTRPVCAHARAHCLPRADGGNVLWLAPFALLPHVRQPTCTDVRRRDAAAIGSSPAGRRWPVKTRLFALLPRRQHGRTGGHRLVAHWAAEQMGPTLLVNSIRRGRINHAPITESRKAEVGCRPWDSRANADDPTFGGRGGHSAHPDVRGLRPDHCAPSDRS